MWKKLKERFRIHAGRYRRLKRYLSIEIAVEYKACLYFCTILFFYCCYLGIHGIFSASIWILIEMILFAYAMCYLQICLFQNFDGADSFGLKEGLLILLCSACYTAASWFFSWFGREWPATVLFQVYMMVDYTSVYLANKVKRRIDTEQLNQMLDKYKTGQKEAQTP